MKMRRKGKLEKKKKRAVSHVLDLIKRKTAQQPNAQRINAYSRHGDLNRPGDYSRDTASTNHQAQPG